MVSTNISIKSLTVCEGCVSKKDNSKTYDCIKVIFNDDSEMILTFDSNTVNRLLLKQMRDKK